jgi:hypothetical protein
MSFSEKVYHFLLRAYPSAYRDRYAAPMEQLFRDRLRDTHTFSGLASFWLRTLADWAVSVPACYRERVTQPTHFGALAESARRCVFFARSEASSFSSREITVEHLLLGILREEPSLVPAGSLEAVQRAIEASEPACRRVPPVEDLRVSEQARRVLQAATEIAQAAGNQPILPRDLAAGILRQRDTLAAQLLREHTT